MSRSSKGTARLIIGMAVTVGAWAQQQPASVTGTVRNLMTGAPLVRAHVMLSRDREKFGAVTNGEGKFSMANLAPGMYFIYVERVGFAGPESSGHPPPVQLQSGETKSLDLQLVPMGAITGRVLDADGEPVQLAHVVAGGADGESAAATDDKGRYRIGGLSPGEYRVRAATEMHLSPPEHRSDGSKEMHYAPTYYGGTISTKGAARVTVQPGADVSGIDIALAVSPLVSVSGKVSDIPAGVREVSVEVEHATGKDSVETFPMRAGKDGTYVIWGLDPGKYTLSAILGDGSNEGDLRSAPADVEVAGSNIEHIDLRMVPNFELRGVLQFEDEKARRAQAKPLDQPHGIVEAKVVLEPSLEGDSVEADISADDTFRLEKVPPGRYRVQVRGGMGTYVKLLRLGSVETEGDLLDVRNGPGGNVLTVMISATMCELAGTVTVSGGPAAGAKVLLMRESRDYTLSAAADENGKYVFTDLAPGKYRLVTADEKTAAILEREGLEDYEGTVEKVELHAGDKLTKDLKKNAAGK